MSADPRQNPRDPAWRPPLDPALPFPPAGEVGHPNLKEHLYAHLPADAVVLDVGCGPGPFEYHRYPPRFIAFDMFEPVSREGLRAGHDEFRLGKLDALPAEDASCDAVVMGFILEHVEAPEVFLREADRVLRPGGWCYVAVPHHRSLEDRLFRLATSVAGSTRGPHIQRFTFENFKALAHGCSGLRLVAWHFLPASYLWMTHPKIAFARRPFLAMLRCLGMLGFDCFREANYQLLFRKEAPEE
ncbi:MAG: hypothetical protein PWP23_1566 [Candidatus Sumerlaeota bacterium]|nr:hypothetical protein [Candidatus Sumerlaeota bacterium]